MGIFILNMKYIYSLAALALISGCSAVKLEREPLLAWSPTPKKDSFPMNYGVPHFGEDHDITVTKKNVADAEKKLGHILDTSDPPKDPPRNYFVPNFEPIKTSLITEMPLPGLRSTMVINLLSMSSQKLRETTLCQTSVRTRISPSPRTAKNLLQPNSLTSGLQPRTRTATGNCLAHKSNSNWSRPLVNE